MAEGMYVPHNY